MHELVVIGAQYLVVVPVIVLGLTFFFLVDKKERKGFVIFAALATVLAVIFTMIAAALHQDPRPFVSDGVTPYFKHSIDNGFPSDHTIFSALIAFIVLRYRRSLGVILLFMALAIGACRVTAGIHHGQDIVGGVVVAGLAVGGATLLMRTIREKSITRHQPTSKKQ